MLKIKKIIPEVTSIKDDSLPSPHVAIYTRTDPSVKSPEASTKLQVKLCTELINRMGWQLVEIISDTAQARDYPGDELREFIRKAKKKHSFDYLVCQDFNRLSLDFTCVLKTINRLAKSGVRVIAVDEYWVIDYEISKLIRQK